MSGISSVNNYSTTSAMGLAGNSNLGKQEFLELLVTQLRHQDPLSPMESQDLAVQLAQFSEVEILNNIDGTLQNNGELDLLLSQAVSNTLAANFVGKSVTSIGNTVKMVNGEETDLNFNLQNYAEDVTVKILDPAGKVVRSMEIKDRSAGAQSVQWDGKDEDGNALSDGNYTFKIEALDADGETVNSLTYSKGLVSAVRYIDGSAILLINGKEIALADVLEIG